MSKRINKKIFPLLFVIATLAQHGSTQPMKKILAYFGRGVQTCEKQCPDPCEQPSNGKKITDIPSYCLHEIFKFVQLDLLDTLRSVNKDFKQAVSCFHPPYPIEVYCENQEISVFYGNIIDNTEKLVLKNFNFKKTKIRWPSKLEELSIEFCDNCDSISPLKSEKLLTLQVSLCHNFDGKFLEGLTKLRTLHVFFCFEFDGNSETVKKLKNSGCKVEALGNANL